MHHLASTERNVRDELINEHVDMALKIARRIAHRLPPTVSREDLESAALLGLTEAAARYDDSRNEPFMAFAGKRVRGAIMDHLRRIDHLSRRGRQSARRMTDAARRLEAELGRPVSDAELASASGMSVAQIRAAHADLRAVSLVHLDHLEVLPQGIDHETVNECIERQRLHTALKCALERLDGRSLRIMALYYQEGLTLREIGQVLGVTESRVCQLRTQALSALREQLS